MNTPVLSWPGLRLLGHLPATIRLAAGLGAGAAAWFLSPADLGTVSRLVAAWDAFGVVTLLLLWAAIFSADIDRIRVVAKRVMS